MTVEVRTEDGWQEVAWIGRKYAARENDDGSHSMALAKNTSLLPNERRRIDLPSDTIEYRIRYRYTRAGDVFVKVASGSPY